LHDHAATLGHAAPTDALSSCDAPDCTKPNQPGQEAGSSGRTYRVSDLLCRDVCEQRVARHLARVVHPAGPVVPLYIASSTTAAGCALTLLLFNGRATIPAPSRVTKCRGAQLGKPWNGVRARCQTQRDGAHTTVHTRALLFSPTAASAPRGGGPATPRGAAGQRARARGSRCRARRAQRPPAPQRRGAATCRTARRPPAAGLWA